MGELRYDDEQPRSLKYDDAPPPARTWWDTAKSAGQTAVDFATAAGSSGTFGMDVRRDALAGWIAGDYPSYSAGVEAEQKRLERQRERSPYVSVAGDVAGAVAMPGMGGAGLATRLGAGAVGGRLVPWAARAAGYGAEGAGVGALQGAGTTYTGNAGDYVKNAAIGAGIGGALGGVGGAAFGPRPLVPSAKAPSAIDQFDAKNIAYKTLEQHPAQYTPSSFAQRADDVTAALRRDNYYNAPSTEGGSPRTFNTVEQMRAPPTAVDPVTGAAKPYLTPADLDAVRKGVTGDRLPPGEYGSGRLVRRDIDDFIRNPPPGAAVPGTEHLAADAARVANTAHQLHGGYKRTQLLENMIANAADTAGATHAGLNLRNELQKAVRSGLRANDDGVSKFSAAGYDTAEQAALRKFARGQGKVSQGLAYADKYLGGGGGLGALAAGAVGGKYLTDDQNNNGLLTGLGTTGAGLALRMIGNRRAANSINDLRNTIAQRNPLYAQRAANAPMVQGGGLSPRTTQTLRDAMTIELLRQRRKSEDN
jgi:hypothetical protein